MARGSWKGWRDIFLNRLRYFDCDDMIDANDDGLLDTADPIHLLQWLFLAGPDLPAPSGICGVEDEGDALGCVESNCS